MDDDVENESLSEEADHDPSFTWIGCPKCGVPINITIPVLDHGYELLAYVYDLLENAPAAEARDAIGEVLPWMGMEINAAHRRNGYFWPFIAAGERAEERARQRAREPSKPSRERKRG
ncbi:MAG: hypothetical protein WDA16_00225 [Candidatus Thermoplasmatota archaeon]